MHTGVPDKTIDYRIYMIGGQPYPYCLRRTPLPGSPVSNASRGGLMDYPPTPPELMDAATNYFAGKLPIPFYCIDFLHDGERFWFSEIEPDGVICPDFADPERTLQREMVKARFEAYRDGHTDFRAVGK